MKIKPFLFTIVACVALIAVGCKSNSVPLPMQKALYVTTVSTGVAFGVERYPEVTPYLRVAQPIICAAGNGTNITPDEIVSALTNSPAANAVATKEGKAIMNGVIAIYYGVFESYGNDWVNEQEQLKNYLQWTCEAVGLGLPPAGQNAHVASVLQVRKLPPHIR